MQAKKLIKAICSVLSAMVTTVGLSHPSEHQYQKGKVTIATVKLLDLQMGLRDLVSAGYDIAGVDVPQGTVDIVFSDKELKQFKQKKVANVVAERSFDPAVAPDNQYTDYGELTESLAATAEKYPNIVALSSIGKSTDGREIWALKISDNPNQRETTEPSIFFNSMHHSREVMTTEVALDMIEVLTTGYGSNQRITEWVDRNEIWIVPMVNPDGNHKVWTSNNMWRKNTRGGYGVDINRNYPYKWGACNGSSGSTWSDTYRGPSAGSEPETQAVMGLVANIKPVLSISYHSYSELVIYPFGCDGSHANDKETVEEIGSQLAGRLPRDGGSGTYTPGTSWEILYAVDGGDIDWYHGEHDVLPYVIEVSASAQGFQPPYSWRQRTVEKQRAGWGYMLDRLAQSGVRGLVRMNGEVFGGSGTVTVEPISELSSVTAPAAKMYRLKSDGTFHVVAKPGMYRVTVATERGHWAEDVVIGESLVEVDVSL